MNAATLLFAGLLGASIFIVGCSSDPWTTDRHRIKTIDPYVTTDNSRDTGEGFTDDDNRELIRVTHSTPAWDWLGRGLRYEVRPGDVLEISIFEWQAEGSRDTLDLRVSEAGEIELPGLGTIQVGGMSVEEIQQRIVAALQEADLIENPRVGVSVSEFQSKRALVAGAVVAPGVYTIPENGAPLSEILSLAGGPYADAGPTALVLRASSKDREKPQKIEVDLDDLFRTRRSDVILSDGDTVFVPRSELEMRESMTLSEALIRAHGEGRTTFPKEWRVSWPE